MDQLCGNLSVVVWDNFKMNEWTGGERDRQTDSEMEREVERKYVGKSEVDRNVVWARTLISYY